MEPRNGSRYLAARVKRIHNHGPSQTVFQCWFKSASYRDTVRQSGSILSFGTKGVSLLSRRRPPAEKCAQYYMNHPLLGRHADKTGRLFPIASSA